MSQIIRALVWKELRQLPRKRGALLTATIFPFFFLFLLPLGQGFGLRTSNPTAQNIATMVAESLPPFPSLVTVTSTPTVLYREFTLPLFVSFGGLIVPGVTATYSLISERERRSLELLVALPVSLTQILWAKLIAVLVLAFMTSLPFFLVQHGIAVGRDLLTPGRVVMLLFVLLAAQTYSAASALVVSLLSRDYRTANNINGALLGPFIVAIPTFLLLAPPGEERLLVLGLGLLVLAAGSLFLAMRVISLERFLR